MSQRFTRIGDCDKGSEQPSDVSKSMTHAEPLTRDQALELVEWFYRFSHVGEDAQCAHVVAFMHTHDAAQRQQIATLMDQLDGAMLGSRNADDLRQELLRDNELILSQRDQLQAQSMCYQDNLTEIQFLKAQIVNREKEVDRMMAQRNLAEAKVAEMKSFELMLRNDVGMLRDESARRLQVNTDLTVLATVLKSKEISYQKAIENQKEVFARAEQREVGYLSELDDYARTVSNLRSRVKACEAEHGPNRMQP